MLAKLFNFIGLIAAYVRLNLNAQLEYRAAFISQVFAMFINDGVWVAFWALFFTRFPVLRGWNVNDVLTVWAVTASGFGIGYAIFGNALGLAHLIAQGQLDVWMLYPRAVLPHILVSRMHTTAWGDLSFGYAVYLLFIRPDLPHLLMFVGLTLSVAMLFVGFSVFTGSLGFYLGNTVELSDQWFNATLHFSTYPGIIFEGLVRILLYTLIPAGFISYLPIEALRQLSLGNAALSVLGSACVLSIGVVFFYRGLRRYESGNLMEMRG